MECVGASSNCWEFTHTHTHTHTQVDEVFKTDEGGLGIRMESTAELDDEGHPHTGSVHHVIQYIHPQGPVGLHNILQEGDEILEINGHILVGLQHQEAIEVVKQTPNFVQVVVCRVIGRNGEGRDGERAESHLAGGCGFSQLF